MKLHEIKLLEAAVGNNPDFLEYDLDEGLELIKSKCSNGLKLFLEGKGFYRSDKNFRKLNGNKVWLVDPSKTTRKSENTTNQYTEIFDNHPEMKDWPKRSSSYIASTSEARASKFSGAPRALIPFDGVKIGFVNKDDMWNINIQAFGDLSSPQAINFLLNSMNLQTLLDIKKFSNELKEKNESALSTLHNNLKLYYGNTEDIEKYTNHFYDEILKAYSPKTLGFTMGTTANLKWHDNSEVWIGGPCFVLSERIQGILTGRIAR